MVIGRDPQIVAYFFGYVSVRSPDTALVDTLEGTHTSVILFESSPSNLTEPTSAPLPPKTCTAPTAAHPAACRVIAQPRCMTARPRSINLDPF